MAFVNAFGVSVSYDGARLIEELKEDILEYGEDEVVAVWCRRYEGVTIYTDYDFIVEEDPISESELKDGEFLIQMPMSALLIILTKQDSIL